jgi:hypothetical protein
MHPARMMTFSSVLLLAGYQSVSAQAQGELHFEVASVRTGQLLGKDSPFGKGSAIPVAGLITGGPQVG